MKANQIISRFAIVVLAAAAGLQSVSAGSIARLYYEDISTASDPAAVQAGVNTLRTNAIFPDSPTFREQLDDFTPDAISGIVNGGLQGRDNSGTQYGTWVRGYLEAPATGDYIFFVASDDNSELWLGTNHVATNAVRIAFESGSGAPLFSGARLGERRSAPIPLTRAQKYHLEILHKQGGGAAALQVGWQRPDGTQEIIPARHLSQHPTDPYIGRFDTNSPPFFNFFGYNGGDLPSTILVNEGGALQLEVDVIAAQPTTFQWLLDGSPIPGQDLSFLWVSETPATYNGTIQVVITNAFGAITSAPALVTVTPDTVPPFVSRVDPHGNANGLRLTFSEKISAVTVAPANFVIHPLNGTDLVIQSATLLPDRRSVQLLGAFDFKPGSNYVVTVSNILDLASTPNLISPNPIVTNFVFGPSPGIPYLFNSGDANGFSLFGTAELRTTGGYDDSGYLKLTDATSGQNGAVLFTERGDVDQFHLQFKARIGDASLQPAGGFSINLAADLPAGTLAGPEEGYLPASSSTADRFIVAFDNFSSSGADLSPSISVEWRGVIVTNVLTGLNGVPALHNANGNWVDVDINLRRDGRITIIYDGVTVVSQLPTGFSGVRNAQLGLAARTGTSFETHWFDDIIINYAEGDIGPVTFAPGGQPGDLTVAENQFFRLSVVPSGASPFLYQWYLDGIPVPGATNRVLDLIATNGTAGAYSVAVTNDFSGTISASGSVTIQPDTIPPHLISARGFAGSLSEVRLVFNEQVDPATATNLATYNFGQLPLLDANLSADGRTINLRTGPQQAHQLYLFRISGLKDRAVAGNVLNVQAAFVSEANYMGEVLADNPVRYWQFDENSGDTVASLTSILDPLATAAGALQNGPTLGVAGLVPNLPEDSAIKLEAASGQRIIVPNGSDLNATAGPWDKKSFEFWFRADSVPSADTIGLASTSGLWEQGAATRNIAVYLWRDPTRQNPNEAELVFNALNNALDGLGAPFGPPGGAPVFVQSTIQVGKNYHVVAVYDGSTNVVDGKFAGNLILYLNGVEVARTNGVGRIYNHTGDVQIGRGNGLVHNGGSGDLGFFDGVLDELSAFNTALPANRVAVHYQAGITVAQSGSGPLSVARVDTRGNPNQILVTFNNSVSPGTATNLANFTLRRADGLAIPVQTATLLGGDRTIQLAGGFGFQVNSNYVLTVGNITDQAIPAGVLSPNPTDFAFGFTPPSDSTYDFNAGLPGGVQLFGDAGITNGGGPDGSGFLKLTDASVSQNGAVLFSERRDVEQFRLRFKARLSDASAMPAEGFSVNLASDLPFGTFNTPEEGYLPATSPNADRFIVSFDNFANNSGDLSPSISVKWRGLVMTNVLTGTGGVPALHNAAGNWVNVDINLKRGGRITVVYDGVPIITNLPTGFDGVTNARLGLAARTSTSYETHWFDDISVNYADGEIGPVGISPDSELAGLTAGENQLVRFAVVPTGVSPFTYQWYFDGALLPGATNRVLNVVATTNSAGNYRVAVSNEFSGAVSAQATLAVDTDSTPPSVDKILALAGSLNEIRITFSEPVDPVTATNLTHYAAGSLSLLGATLSADGHRVTLKTAPLQLGQNYTVQIIGVLDRSARGNSLSGQLSVPATVSYVDEVLADGPTRYWRFDETNGVTAFSLTSVLDTLATAQATFVGSPALGQSSLVPNTPGDPAIRFQASSSQRATVPNGADLNITAGPWAKKTVEFWFNAASVPAPGTTGLTSAAGLWEQGAVSRGLSIYLWRDPANANPAQAELVFHAWNNAISDGPGAPFGATNNPATFVHTTITIGVTYHIVAVFDGNDTRTGNLILYVNGVEASRTGNIGQIYNHSSDVQIARGNTLIHTLQVAGALAFYDGLLDELSVYNKAFTPERVAFHYQVGRTTVGSLPPAPWIKDVRVLGGNIIVTWDGPARLERALEAAGPYIEVNNTTSPHSESVIGQPRLFFRLKN